MCLAAKRSLQGRAAKHLLLWVGIFHFFSFQIFNHVTAVSIFWLAYNDGVWNRWGIAGYFPVQLHRTLCVAECSNNHLDPNVLYRVLYAGLYCFLIYLFHFLAQCFSVRALEWDGLEGSFWHFWIEGKPRVNAKCAWERREGVCLGYHIDSSTILISSADKPYSS